MFDRNKKDGAGNAGVESEVPGTDYASSGKNPAPAPSRAGSRDVAVIGRSIRINGDLQGEEDLKIEGDVTGTVKLHNNTLTIGSEGKISANVYAKSVTVDGSMDGDVFGFERVSIRKNAQVRGNITAPRVSLEDGAKFKGSIEMDSAAVEAAFGRNPGGSSATSGPAPKIASVAGTEAAGGASGKTAKRESR